MKGDRIPLFPLELVLFPGMFLPLHIFEPRYKVMIARCLEENLEFGVVLARREGLARLGCSAEIIKVVKKYEDGRMDILTVGQTRYRVLELFEEQPYLEAAIEYLEDDREPSPAERPERLLDLYIRCHQLIYHRAPAVAAPSPGSPLAFHIATELPLDLGYRQELLEIEREVERQQSLLERLKRWVRELEESDRFERRASGNGRGGRRPPL